MQTNGKLQTTSSTTHVFYYLHTCLGVHHQDSFCTINERGKNVCPHDTTSTKLALECHTGMAPEFVHLAVKQSFYCQAISHFAT